MLGSLDPWKGITPYCEEVFSGLEEYGTPIQFMNWEQLYPRWLYPGGDPKKADAEPPQQSNVLNVLSWWNPASWYRAARRTRGEIVHAQWWSFPLIGAYLGYLWLVKRRGHTVVLTVHDVKPHERSLVNNALNRLIYLIADHFVVHSEENKHTLCSEYDIDTDRVTVIPHPTIQNVPSSGVTTEEAKSFLGVPQEDDVLLLFGGIRDYKGIDILLRLLPDILERREDLTLLIAGACWDDWEKYERIIDEEGVRDHVKTRVEFIPDDEIEYYFAASDLVVFPYRHFDAQSGVASVANFFGVYSIGFDRGGLADQITETVDNEAELVDRIAELLEEGPDPPSSGGEVDNRECMKKHADLYSRLHAETEAEAGTGSDR
ncbi:glycosyltransferase [Candidatus Halobonum tyrrellensis]|uniref:Group 1 glycosyl transferase n=1 Tax=Candidatus Halobonum tyrrellensis G22 TaxID=1324957 RepID=V4H8C4_9EURY|nr:glycosyltransferase [Candidatus Halobonum tyrrellensis]ESP86935.1 group 1 glycosyl transferase [Candidatus Halobonum tyrrellensis G22]